MSPEENIEDEFDWENKNVKTEEIFKEKMSDELYVEELVQWSHEISGFGCGYRPPIVSNADELFPSSDHLQLIHANEQMICSFHFQY